MKPEVILFRHSQGDPGYQFERHNVGSVGARSRVIAGEQLNRQKFLDAVETTEFIVFVFEGTVTIAHHDLNGANDRGWDATRLVEGEVREPWSPSRDILGDW